MKRNRKGFTLIELIIVVTIVGILALVAIPKYFANIEKARKAEAVSTMRSIREAMMGYYSVNASTFPSGFPITVVVDNETVLSIPTAPVSSNFTYTYTSSTITATTKITGGVTYNMDVASGSIS